MYIFILINFIISAISDIILNYLSRQSYSTKLIQSLKIYFEQRSTITSSIYAGLTVVITLIITILMSKLLFNFWYPKINLEELIKFLGLCFFIGYISDIVIYHLQIFGNSLNNYYSLTTPGFWGAIAFIFSVILSLILNEYGKKFI
jgi:hypothetical protein